MVNGPDKYEAVIGLEIHAQLATLSKLFCGDSVAFGASPNTQISPITMGHPGTLPKTNEQAVALAVKLGLACQCRIEQDNYFARKNYFYPDLPKGYQISQHTTPICVGGFVSILTNGVSRNVQLNRIHMEEDAGKSIHDLDLVNTCIDLNRAGTPLVEIVTEPDLFSAEEAWQFVTEIRKLLRWIEVCDGNMEEGSLRCDANVSIRLKGTKELGTKVEVKNLNSIRNVKKAIEFEIERMIELVEAGGMVQQQTRSFDATSDTSFAIREKEDANDYRYFPDPDLAPFHLSKDFIDSIAQTIPALPNALAEKFVKEYQLSEYDAAQLTADKATSDYYVSLIACKQQYKSGANWLLGPVRQYLNEQGIGFAAFQLAPASLSNLIEMVDNNLLSFSIASTKIFLVMVTENKSALDIAESFNLLQINDESSINEWVDQALRSMPDKVLEYQKGKKGLLGLFVGQVKKLSLGKADPKLVTQLLEQKLNHE